ncbi:protein of unknown function [Terribacillus halophilus]|uniref:DUF5068 domain-containing protein n=1 Tax=Terribacillus halophilus TaxID=361279 RepID=A0A1G6LCY6_9BACI|nr:DUF5068 domain-containing protein [Terribacillus halophilus]SDC41071.1 protein of unknown function [Terribacillus halophilus]
MNKKLMLLLGAMLSIFVITGCGMGNKEASKDEKPAASEESKSEDKAAASEDNTADTTTEADTESSADQSSTTSTSSDNDTFNELIDYMKTTTEAADATVFYENLEPQTHDMDGVTASLDAYSIVGLNDFHTDYSIPFNDETNGGVVLAQFTITNDTDQDVHYMPSMYMSIPGAPKQYNNYRNILPEEDQLPTKLSPDNEFLLKAGESVTGTYTYPIGESHLYGAIAAGEGTIEVPTAQTDPDDIKTAIGRKGSFSIDFSSIGAEETETTGSESETTSSTDINEGFYEDSATLENMGDKKMLDQKEGIGESQQLGDTTVTLEGYQFTEFTPNMEQAPRFEDFNGVVLLTVKYTLDNQTDDNIGLSGLGSTLTVDDSWWQLNEGMLTNYRVSEIIKSGESGELLQVYVLDKEEYDKLWKDKSFEIELGPIRNEDAEDISKGKEAVFQLK